jgi:diguanylate cyclase
LLATFLSFQVGAVGPAATAYLATAGLILISSIIENSYFLAYHDELTTLPARRAFTDALLRLEEPYAIAVVDIDHFKKFNDTYGHQVGDQVLRLVAKVLQDHVRDDDLAARYGGEELVAVFPGVDLAACAQIAERIRVRISEARLTRRTTGQAISSITVSIGVAQFRLPEAAEVMIERCDRGLYQAKRSGRNRTVTENDIEGDTAAA